MNSLLRWLLCSLLALSLSGCRPYPDRLLVEGESAYPEAWPILFGGSEINGKRMAVLGEGLADVSMLPPTDSSHIELTLRWAEYHSGQSWVAEVKLPLALGERFQNTASLKIVIGRMGAIEIMSGPFGNAELRSTGVFCAERTPALDETYSAEIAYLAGLENWEPPGQPIAPAPPSPCENR